jgi:O-antigen/teichoic acid export membrane protein
VEAAGIYNVARQLAGIIRKFNGVYTSTVFPEIARLGSQGDIDGARRLNRRMLLTGLALGAAAVLLAAIFGSFVIKLLFGARFGPAYLPFVILTAAAIAQLISETPSMCVQIFRGPRFLLILNGVAVGVFVIAAFALTRILSISGMALAQLVFSVVLGILCNLALRNYELGSAGRQTALDDV